MALSNSLPGALINIRPLGAQLAEAKTHALLTTASMELMRVVLQAGRGLPPHSVAGDITLLCIEGHVRLQAQAGDHERRAGDLVLLPGGDRHSLQAIEDSSLLVAVLLARPTTSDASAA